MPDLFSIVLNSSDFAPSGKVIGDELFGGNFLFDRDRTDPSGTFDAKREALDISFVRYPGGTITEDFFRLTDPDRTVEAAANSGRLEPLSDFIAYAVAKKLDYSLVIPMKKYAQDVDAGRMSLDAALGELRGFLLKLKNGDFGDKAPTVIELGNEYYTMENVSGREAAEMYGALAVEFAKEVRAAFGDSVDIAVQAGDYLSNNRIIMSHFEGKAGLVDDVIVHSYPWRLDTVDDHHRINFEITEAWLDKGLASGVFLSEWNLSNQRRDSQGNLLQVDEIERGSGQSAAMVELLAGYAKAGVERAAVWPLQQNTAGDLAGRPGELAETDRNLTERSLTLTGETFRLMSEELVGTKVLNTKDLDIDGAAETERFQHEVLIEAFSASDRVVVFASGWALEPDQIGTALTVGIDGAYDRAEVTSITSAGYPLGANAKAVVVTNVVDGIDRSSDVKLSFSAAYETLMVVYHKAPAVSPVAGLKPVEAVAPVHKPGHLMVGGSGVDDLTGTGGADTLRGGNGDDKLFGGQGDDILHGGRGSDRVGGGADNDRIFGHGDADMLLGYSGHDTIGGGSGDDIARGGGGDDMIRGGAGIDELFGGSGDDTLYGGKDDDLVVGNAGDDVLCGDLGNDDVRGHRGDDVVKGGDGDDRLNGGQGDDTLQGGGGADRLDGGTGDDWLDGGGGADMLKGGRGADTFVFSAGPADVVMDFQQGEDLIFVGDAAAFGDLRIAERDGGVLISFDGFALLVLDAGVGEFTAADFIF